MVPTTIDTGAYVRESQTPNGDAICIGWSGSMTTIQHFDLMIPVLRRLRERYGDAVRFKVIGDGRYRDEALGIQGQDWSAETEVSDLSEIDIGVMPLPDDEWARGKCGLKGPPVHGPRDTDRHVPGRGQHRDHRRRCERLSRE